MANTLRITVDDRGLRRKLPREYKSIKSKAGELAKYISEQTKKKAKDVAPKDPKGSGALVSLIKIFKEGGDKYSVITLNPKSNRLWPGKGKYGSNFDLPRWMHETGGVFQSDNPFGKAGTKHIHTGNPRYMYVARDYAKKNKTRWAKMFFKKK
jgi:hypothetical protein